MGGDDRQSEGGDAWRSGEYWNVDSNSRPMVKEGKPRWQTLSRGEQFRAADSFPCDATERANAYRTMRRSTSSPATNNSATEARSGREADLTSGGTLFGSRSCWGWDCHGHAARREAAKTSLGVHSPMAKVHSQAYPFKEGGLELQPAAIYTRNFCQHGEDSLRVHKPQHVRGFLGSGTKKTG